MEEAEETSNTQRIYRSGSNKLQTAMKDRNESYYTGVIRISGLHDLLSRHHRPNGEGMQMPVGDIS